MVGLQRLNRMTGLLLTFTDPMKGKYFRIQANHVAPSGAAYSADSVKKRKLASLAVQEERSLRLLRGNHVRRARILQDPLLGGALSREHGYGIRDEPAQVFARGLFSKPRLDNSRDPMDQSASISAFTHHDRLKTLFVGKQESEFPNSYSI